MEPTVPMPCGAGHDHAPQASAMPAAETRPPKTSRPIEAGVVRVPLAMPNGAADLSARADMSAVGSPWGAVDAEPLYPRLERGALETEAGGGPLRTSENPVGLVQRSENGFALRRLERGGAPGRPNRATAELRHGHAKCGSARQDDGALDRVFELAHVSRPGIA